MLSLRLPLKNSATSQNKQYFQFRFRSGPWFLPRHVPQPHTNLRPIITSSPRSVDHSLQGPPARFNGSGSSPRDRTLLRGLQGCRHPWPPNPGWAQGSGSTSERARVAKVEADLVTASSPAYSHREATRLPHVRVILCGRARTMNN